MKWILCFLLLVVTLKTQATEMVGAISAGLGGTGRAAVESIESLYLNPAGLALVDEFHFGAAYQTGFISEGVSRNTYGVNLTDGTDGVIFPGSLGYRRHTITQGGNDFKEQEIKGGLGYRATDRLSLGLAYTYLDGEDSSGQVSQQHNVDFGVLFGLMPNWGVSLSGENLVDNTNKNLPDALKRLSRLAFGTQYVFKKIMIGRYEVLSPLYEEENSLLTHRFGIGAILKANFMLSLGYSVDNFAQQNWGSLGLIWKGPRLKLAYSLQKEYRQELGNRHLVDLWLDL